MRDYHYFLAWHFISPHALLQHLIKLSVLEVCTCIYLFPRFIAAPCIPVQSVCMLTQTVPTMPIECIRYRMKLNTCGFLLLALCVFLC